MASLAEILRCVFIVGPDPPRTEDRSDPLAPEAAERKASRWDTLLAWPTRLVAVAGALLIGWIWAKTPAGIQLGWGLQYGSIVAISIVTSFWAWILLANLFVAGAWVALSWRAPADLDVKDVRWGLPDVVTWINRQVEHIEAMAVWAAIALIVYPGLTVQLLLLGAVAFLGAPIINGLARTSFFGGEKARGSRAALIIERRSVIYLATFIGLLLLTWQAPRQWWTIAPLLLSVLPGLALRFGRFRRRQRLDDEHRRYRLARADLQQRSAHLTGWIGPTLVAAFFVVAAGLSFWQRQKLAADSGAELDGPAPPADACARQPGGPTAPAALAVFVVADTQLHELAGRRFPGQMEAIDTLVPLARRPVELDVLSTAAAVRFETVYGDLAREREKLHLAPPLWTHLGDLADLSCTGEMERMTHLLHGYGAGRRLLAGIAPGNHDSAFTGNFGWSPYWDQACQGRMDKSASDERLGRFLTDHLTPEGRTQSLSGWWAPAALGSSLLSRFTVTPLGTVPIAPGRARGVVGVFIDTSDRFVRDFGIAGLFGTFSERQEERILAAIAEIRGRPAGDPWADPWFVIFGHIPRNELTASSRRQLDHLVETLDDPRVDCAAADESCRRPRVIALVSAHTHVAGSHRHCVAQRQLREIVVGSVIDPPQQAAVLEIGVDDRGRGAARLTTLPSVARPGLTCSTGQAISAGECRRVMSALAAAPECQEVLGGRGSGDEPGASCESLERPLSLEAHIQGIIRHGGPQDPAQIKVLEDKRARALLDCVCRATPTGRPPPACAARALDGETYAPAVEALTRDPLRQQELTCLSWAASVIQKHKANGMTMADAIRCAFDDPTVPPAQVSVAVAEDVPCH